MFTISYENSKLLRKLLIALSCNKMATALNISQARTAGEIPAMVERNFLVPCQGRCPKECSQGIDEQTGENCTHCNGWGFIEDTKSDPWIYDMEAAKSQDRCMLITKTGGVLSPCSWFKAGEVSKDGFWIIWNRAAPDYFDEVIDPVGWMPIPESKRYPFNAQEEENPIL